jgi:hypothetical protein
LSPTLLTTPKLSSPISATMGVHVFSPFDTSRKKSELPFLPVPRSETVSTAKRSSSVVSRKWKRCGWALSS